MEHQNQGKAAETKAILAKWNPVKGSSGGNEPFSIPSPPVKVPPMKKANPKTIATRS